MGTLGTNNHASIVSSLQSLLRRRRLSKIFFIGDLNLHGVCWDTGTAGTPIEQAFVDSFTDFGLAQCVDRPTHRGGNLLDVVLTNSVSSIGNLSVLDEDSVCRSDHFPIRFNVKMKVGKNKPIKRTSYNFKTANWDGLNFDLCHTNWNAMLDCTEPELAWRKFKSRLFELADVHVKKSYSKI